VYPILGAVLKFHKDDDDDPPPQGSGGATHPEEAVALPYQSWGNKSVQRAFGFHAWRFMYYIRVRSLPSFGQGS
jgi:hypothetical protein